MFEHIPQELKERRQWVVWRFVVVEGGKPTKVPLNPWNGWEASVKVPAHWSDFETAVRCYTNPASGVDGIGWVFTDNDEYCGIDLDYTEDAENNARQQKIFDLIPSYAEYSPSGKGLHIICRASVPHGRKRASIEIYSSGRYFTFTGNVFRHAPITNQQEMVMQLWQEMGPAATADNFYRGWETAQEFDDDLHQRILAGGNGDLYDMLVRGEWQDNYPSQSEADLALFNILAFYTEHKPQIIRMFRASGLGKRDKAARDTYMEYCLNKAFDLKAPPIDMTQLVAAAEQAIIDRHADEEKLKLRDLHEDVTIKPAPWRDPPPGLISDIASFILGQSAYPVPEISLTAALGMLAGIVGRAYNVNGTGLNQYIMMVAETGRGKEAMSSGINKLFAAVAFNECPDVYKFMGPADIASGAAIIKYLAAEERIPCCVAITGEVGIRLQQISSPNAHAGDSTLRRVLLDIYGKSGFGQTLRPMIYSDAKNNTGIINSPALTWLGESTPLEFYKALDTQQIASGLIPRFLIVEYKGPRTAPNRNMIHHPPNHVVTRVSELVRLVMDVTNNNGKIDVQFAPDALTFAHSLEDRINKTMNQNADGPYVQLLNREYLKTIKLASLVAISHNFHSPTISKAALEWAYAIVAYATELLSNKFRSGEISNGAIDIDNFQQLQTLASYVTRIYTKQVKIGSEEEKFREASLVSFVQMQRGLMNLAIFRRDKRGAKRALEETIIDAVSAEVLEVVPVRQATAQFGTKQKLYAMNLIAAKNVMK